MSKENEKHPDLISPKVCIYDWFICSCPSVSHSRAVLSAPCSQHDLGKWSHNSTSCLPSKSPKPHLAQDPRPTQQPTKTPKSKVSSPPHPQTSFSRMTHLCPLSPCCPFWLLLFLRCAWPVPTSGLLCSCSLWLEPILHIPYSSLPWIFAQISIFLLRPSLVIPLWPGTTLSSPNAHYSRVYFLLTTFLHTNQF